MTEQAACSIAQFCADHSICRSHFYNMLKIGMGPRTMKIGKRTLISREAAAEWRAKHTKQMLGWPSEQTPKIKAWVRP